MHKDADRARQLEFLGSFVVEPPAMKEPPTTTGLTGLLNEYLHRAAKRPAWWANSKESMKHHLVEPTYQNRRTDIQTMNDDLLKKLKSVPVDTSGLLEEAIKAKMREPSGWRYLPRDPRKETT
jgi:hypothetical protein